MLSRRRLLAGGLAATLLPGLTACGATGKTTFYGADMHPSDYPTVQGFARFGELLEQRTGGRLKLKIFSGGQLGAERDTLEITSFGGIDFNRIALAPLNSIEPLTIVPALPFLFEDEAHMRRALDGEPGRQVLAALSRHGLVGLAFYDSGARSFYNTKRPIERPDDMRGLKLRVQNSDLYVALVRALGADATPMDLGEVYQALAQGVIDGAENNWPSYQSGRHYEVAPFYSLTNHVIAPEVLLMAKASWDGLAPADREIVLASARDSVPYMRRLWDARVAAAHDALLAAGVRLNRVETEPFRERMRPVWESFVVTPEQRALMKSILAMGGGNG
jgi:tripartite ATP-independent transporter DctP family solute receptor